MQTGSRVGTAVSSGLGLFAQAALILAIIGSTLVAVSMVSGRAPSGAEPALAGKVSSSWISLAGPAGAAATAQPSLGSAISFDTGYPTTVKNPRIEVLCYQAGSLVYGEAGGVNDTFLLGGGSSTWLEVGGSADCVANLNYFGQHAGQQTYNKLATTSFAAG